MAIRTNFARKSAAAALAVLTLGAGLTINSGAAEARYGRQGAAIAGIVGVLAAGALIAGAANAHAQPYHGYHAEPEPVYYPRHHYQTPVYETVHPVHPGYHRPHHRRDNRADVGFDNVRQSCTTKKQMVWDGYSWVKHKYLACR